ncbi:MAG: NADH dehydrogenase (quinone) subunit G [Chloroflexi bacterium]|nr:NADH dehydrogenase (quinone) subunit G [Chloroflexota bacterium]
MTEKIAVAVAENLINLTIDNREVSVPAGTLVVNAAKLAGIDIPVFCYHPKMEPVGMCRMCLVEIGRPAIDRASGKPLLNKDGSPQINFGPKLETGCTVPVSKGMVVRGYTEEVTEARKEVIEFLLTSHPLDCPICDKGGECPLQNLTMEHGPGQSRFIFDEKIDLAKNVPLGDLIFLDRERCIQCARCTRFQDEIVDDPVIGFSQRGRALEIITFSDPGFDSYWSGNTTDICPVGALTTTDFRFEARPWELQSHASICNHCSVGCNTTLNTRREAKSGGDEVIKRVMPRQNEQVNEIWICDKGRFAHHYTESPDRLTQPLIRKGDALEPATWDEALQLVGDKFKKSKGKFAALAGGRLTNEDFFNIQQVTAKLGGKALLDSQMAGGEMVAQVGVGQGTNLSDLRAGDVVLVIASDLEEEAPLHWLRIKQAAERGAQLIVANPRRTKLDQVAHRLIRYEYGQEAAVVHAMLDSFSPKRPDQPASVKQLLRDESVKAAAEDVQSATNLIVFYGSEGLDVAGSHTLASACANLLIATGHVGRSNNGLVAVWDKGNAQGAWDAGFATSVNLADDLAAAPNLYIVGADPVGDRPDLAETFEAAEFVVVQELFLTKTAQMADVVLPVLPYTEREGTYTNAERRVQRFYPAISPRPGARADFAIAAQIGLALGLELESKLASLAFEQLAARLPAYKDLTYGKLAETFEQWPIIGREDLYYGGTTYDNTQGLGVQPPSGAERGESPALSFEALTDPEKRKGLLAVPVTRLYDLGLTVTTSEILATHWEQPHIVLSPADAEKLGLELGAQATIKLNNMQSPVAARIDNRVPKGVVLVPRSVGLHIFGPAPIEVGA